MAMEEGSPGSAVLPVGTRVEVRNRFTGNWAAGFKIAEQVQGGEFYYVERISDGARLPEPFPAEDVRRARKSANTWWVRRF
jgi:hypothetical protein